MCLFDFGLCTKIPRAREDQIRDSRFSDYTPVESARPADDDDLLPRYDMTGHTGSIRYMAPEVAMDMPYNQSVDVYSFSIILWEMVHRKRPYAQMNVTLHRARVCENQERPHLKSNMVLTDLADLLRAGWAHNMHARPAFSEVLQTLRKIRAEASNINSRESPFRCMRLKFLGPLGWL